MDKVAEKISKWFGSAPFLLLHVIVHRGMVWYHTFMKQIQLSGKRSDLYMLIDDEDYEELSKYNWFYQHDYARRNHWLGGKNHSVYAHSVIMPTPKGMGIDHRNGNGLDNRKANLRICTQSSNCKNRSKAKNNKSGYKGVSRFGNRWRAYSSNNGKHVHLGLFDTKEEAALAYNAAAIERFGRYAKLNPVP